jgi:hypothetical protein
MQLLDDLPALEEAIAAERERAVEQLRQELPGFEGRLEGPRLFVTPEELEQLRAGVEFKPARLGNPLALYGVDLIVEDPDGC